MGSTKQEIVLISGGNTGLGFQIAKVLLRDHGDRFYVIIGSRTLSKGDAAIKDLHDHGFNDCEAVHLEVTDDESIAKAANMVAEKFGRLDVLHVNAGIAPDKDMIPAGDSISKIINVTMQTNVAGAAQTADTFIPLLQKADNPRIIFMSTGLGSLQWQSTFANNKAWPAYSSSKAALNMIMLWFWRRFPEMKVNACAPGFRPTALNNFGEGAPPNIKPGDLELGARNAVRLTLLGKDGETGKFTQWKDDAEKHEKMPW